LKVGGVHLDGSILPTGRWEHQERRSSTEYGKRETFQSPVLSQGSKKHNKGPASFKLRACMGGKKSPQIHHHHSGDKEPLERTGSKRFWDTAHLPLPQLKIFN